MSERNDVVEGRQLCTFMVNDLLLGVDVVRVQEVIRQQTVTGVPLAPPVVSGLINLRGQIVTAMDLRRRLSLPPRDGDHPAMNVVVSTPEAPISLLVDEIGDVVEVASGAFEAQPPTLPASLGAFLTGIYKLDQGLLLVLDVDRVANLNGADEDALDARAALASL